MSNSTFQSYRHQSQSIIMAYSSVVTLTGNVNFSDSISGILSSKLSSSTAVYLETTHPEVKSSLSITTGATVYFVNLTCNNNGGAMTVWNSMIHIDAKVRVVFMNNIARHNGGAVAIYDGKITIGTESCVIFKYNHAAYGGALSLQNSIAHVNTSGIEFYDNRASAGGAIYFTYRSIIINTNTTLKFITNSAQVSGGAIYIEAGVHPSIIVGNLNIPNYSFSTTLHFKEVLSIVPYSGVGTTGAPGAGAPP